MKIKLGNFLEVFGIVLGIVLVVAFVILLIMGDVKLGVVSLISGICVFIVCLSLSQMLFSLSRIEEDTEMLSKRMEVLETINREAVSNDLFSTQPKKRVNQVQRQNIPPVQETYQTPQNNTYQPVQQQQYYQSDTYQPQVQQVQTGQMASCYKCGHQGVYEGNNFCPKCGNHSFYTEY